MFVGKARSLPKSGAPKRCFIWAGSGSTHKLTRLERLGRDKPSSLLRKFVNYERKKFYNIGPWFMNKMKIIIGNAIFTSLSRPLWGKA